MENRSEVRDCLVSRRSRLTPEQAGIPTTGTRRVPGLRRGEVAQLAGVSVEYSTQLERGSIRGASDAVLDAVARALELDDAERTHLFDLARAANTGAAARRRPPAARVRPVLQQILDAQLSPAWVCNARGDVVAANVLGRAVCSPLFDKRLRHPVVGDLDLAYEGLALLSDRGLALFVYTAEPGSRSQEALDLLAAWATSPDDEDRHESRARTPDRRQHP